MPDTLQFTNGNQIVHHYDAMGNRLRTTYYTRKVALVEPATNTIPGTDNLQEYNMVSYITLGNKRYVRYGHDGWGLQYVYNPEGYIKYWGEEEHYPYYYIKDHLGSVRETYIRPYVNEKYCEQRMQYYPSGLPWDVNLNPSYQSFKYGSKEFVEMHGLDEYDSEARWYYPAIMRTTTMDPMCEKYYSTSPYVWCGNNPVNYVDPDGRWLAVTRNDDDEDTYTIVGGAIDFDDCNVYIVESGYNVEKQGKPIGVEVLGKTATPYSFSSYNENTKNDEFAIGSIINMNDKSGDNFLAQFQKNEVSLLHYAFDDPQAEGNFGGGNGGRYDFKVQNGSDPNRGMPLSILGGRIGTARDVGNFAAGYLTGRKWIPYTIARWAFDRYQNRQTPGCTTGEPPVSRFAQDLGWRYGKYARPTYRFGQVNIYNAYW